MTLPLSVRMDRWIRRHPDTVRCLRELWVLAAMVGALVSFTWTVPPALLDWLIVAAVTWVISRLTWDVTVSGIRRRSDYLLDQGTRY